MWHGRDLRHFKRILAPPLQQLLTQVRWDKLAGWPGLAIFRAAQQLLRATSVHPGAVAAAAADAGAVKRGSSRLVWAPLLPACTAWLCPGSMLWCNKAVCQGCITRLPALHTSTYRCRCHPPCLLQPGLAVLGRGLASMPAEAAHQMGASQVGGGWAAALVVQL